MKRIFAALAAVLIIGAIAAAIGTSGAGASSSSAQERTSQGIVIGHYEGRDSHGNHIRFRIDHHDAFVIPTFRINHVELGAVHVLNGAFSHDCNTKLYCAHGHWTNIDQVSGGWRHRHGYTVAYTAHWVERWSGN